MLKAAITVLMPCSFSMGSCGGPPPSASGRARAPPAAARARGRPAASDRRASARAAPSALRLAIFPFAHLLIGVVLGAAVALLDLADQLVALPRELVELVVGELAPALLERAFHLLPVAGNAIPVHDGPRSVTSLTRAPVGPGARPWLGAPPARPAWRARRRN